MAPPNRLSLQEVVKQHPELRVEDIQSVQEWMSKQPHLPKFTDAQIIPFLHSCFYSIEKAKKTIEFYLTVRTNTPEVFSQRNPCAESLQNVWKVIQMVELPQKTADGFKIIFSGFVDSDPAKYHYEDTMKAAMMMLDMYIDLDPFSEGYVFVLDMAGTTLGHLVKLNMSIVKKVMEYVQEGVPIRMKQIHIINTFALLDPLMTLVRPFMNKEFAEMHHFHAVGSDSLYKFVPKELLPSDLGGEMPSLEELSDTAIEKLKQYEDWFTNFDKLKVNESRRTGKCPGNNSFGIEGSFKKLEID